MRITHDFESGLTAERLREILNYDPLTGIFRWRAKISQKVVVGRIAGSIYKGYWGIRIDRRKYMAHRLAWLFVHGTWPINEIDHKDLMRTHNWIDNLRQATSTQNKGNVRPRHRNGTGYKGVFRCRDKWRAEIRINRKNIHLGVFDTPETAHEAYAVKAKELFGEFARLK